VLPDVNITTMAIKIPTTHMHLHSLIITLPKKTTREEAIAAFEREQRIMLVEGKMGFKSTSHVIDWARWKGRPRNDVYEAVIWKESVRSSTTTSSTRFWGPARVHRRPGEHRRNQGMMGQPRRLTPSR